MRAGECPASALTCRMELEKSCRHHPTWGQRMHVCYEATRWQRGRPFPGLRSWEGPRLHPAGRQGSPWGLTLGVTLAAAPGLSDHGCRWGSSPWRPTLLYSRSWGRPPPCRRAACPSLVPRNSPKSRQHTLCPSRVIGHRAVGLVRRFPVICIPEARDCFSVGVNMGPGDGVLKPKGKVRAGH